MSLLSDMNGEYMQKPPQVALDLMSTEELIDSFLQPQSDYHETVTSDVQVDSDNFETSLKNAMRWFHLMYPTAFLDYYETEEAMLRDA